MPTPCIHCQHPLNTPGICANCKSIQTKSTSSTAIAGRTSAVRLVSSLQVSPQSLRPAGARQQQPQPVHDHQLQITQQLQARSRLTLQPRQVRIAAPRVLNRHSSRPRLNQVRCTNSSALQVNQQVQQQLRQHLRVHQNAVSPQGPTRYRVIPKSDLEHALKGNQEANRTQVVIKGSSSSSPIRIISSPSSAHISTPIATVAPTANTTTSRITHLVTALEPVADHSAERSQQLLKVVEPIVSAVVSPTTPPVSSQYEVAVSNGQTPPLYKILYPIPPRPAIASISSSQLTPLTVSNSQIVSSLLVTPSGAFQVFRHATTPSAQPQHNNSNFKQITHQSSTIMGPTQTRMLRSKGSAAVINRLAIEPPPVVTIDDEDPSSNQQEEEEKMDDGDNDQEMLEANYYGLTILDLPDGGCHKGVFRIRALQIRIGTFLLKDRWVTISKNNLLILARRVDSLTDEVMLSFSYDDIIKTIWALCADTPGILFNFSPSCGPRVRKLLRMKEHEAVRNRQCDDAKHPYFEPSSTLERQRRIIILLGQRLSAEEYAYIQDCYISPKGSVKREFAEKLLELTQPNTTTEETPVPTQDDENRSLANSTHEDQPGTSSTLRVEARKQRIESNLPKIVSGSELVAILKPSVTRVAQTSTKLPKDVVFTNESPMCQYPPSGKGCIVIRAQDFLTLLPDKSVNDAVIDFYLSFIIGELLPKERAEKVFAFNTFFYSSLMKEPLKTVNSETTEVSVARRQHANVKRWTKGVDLFAKDFILIPVCEHSHWFLIMVCFPWLVPKMQGINLDQERAAELEEQQAVDQPSTKESPVPSSETSEVQQVEVSRNLAAHTASSSSQQTSDTKGAIYIFDSLRGNVQASKIYPMIRGYLAEEFLAKKKVTCAFNYYNMRGYYPNAPQQTNFHDCGIFLLEFAKQFLLNPPTPQTMGTANSFNKMFDPDSIMEKGRWDVAEVMLQLSEKQYPELKGVPRLKYEKLIKVEGKTIVDDVSPPKKSRTINSTR